MPYCYSHCLNIWLSACMMERVMTSQLGSSSVHLNAFSLHVLLLCKTHVKSTAAISACLFGAETMFVSHFIGDELPRKHHTRTAGYFKTCLISDYLYHFQGLEADLEAKIEETRNVVDDSFRNNIDTATAVDALLKLTAATHKYMTQRDADRANSGDINFLNCIALNYNFKGTSLQGLCVVLCQSAEESGMSALNKNEFIIWSVQRNSVMKVDHFCKAQIESSMQYCECGIEQRTL